MEKVTLIELKEACKNFDKFEQRGSFYELALNLVEKGFETEGFILLLSTWNSSRFKIFVNSFDINYFKRTIKQLNPIFMKLKTQTLNSANFYEINDDIKAIYKTWSEIKGVEYTGTSKIMHLKNPNLFVMWDDSIRTHYGLKNNTFQEYVEFLKKMQELSKNINWNDDSKTLAKAIDEYNYVKITLSTGGK